MKINIEQFRAHTSITSPPGNFAPNWVHWWGNSHKSKTQAILTLSKININANVKSIKVNAAGTQNEVYPPYDSVGVLLYIGVM